MDWRSARRGFYVASVIVLTPRLGVATMIGLAIAGQIGLSVVLDHFGLLGLPHHPVSLPRLIGVGLLVAGVRNPDQARF